MRGTLVRIFITHRLQKQTSPSYPEAADHTGIGQPGLVIHLVKSAYLLPDFLFALLRQLKLHVPEAILDGAR